jgi:hypothetical protein
MDGDDDLGQIQPKTGRNMPRDATIAEIGKEKNARSEVIVRL